MPVPYPVARHRLDRALVGRDLATVETAGPNSPADWASANALAVLVLMEKLDDPRFERAAVRWISPLLATSLSWRGDSARSLKAPAVCESRRRDRRPSTPRPDR